MCGDDSHGVSPAWVLRRPLAEPRFRLFCFSCAGGSATDFSAWQGFLGPQIEVCAIQLPGRGTRMREPPSTSMAQIVQSASHAIARMCDVPYACFGHSLGALLAFEVARYCRQHALPMPMHLFVAGCEAPRYLAASDFFARGRDDRAMVALLKEFGGTPPALLENDELMRLVLPALRADFSLVENYHYRPLLPLSLPITVLAGLHDQHTRSRYMAAWATETSAMSNLHWFSGGHFFVKEQAQAVLAYVMAALA